MTSFITQSFIQSSLVHSLILPSAKYWAVSVCHALRGLFVQHSDVWSEHPHYWGLLQHLDLWRCFSLCCVRWSWRKFCCKVRCSSLTRHHHDSIDWPREVVCPHNANVMRIQSSCYKEEVPSKQQCGCYSRMFAQKFLSMWPRNINYSNGATYTRCYCLHLSAR